MLFHRLTLVSLAVVFTACTPALVPQQGKVAKDQAVTCQNVTPTGSNMPRRKCTTAAQRKAQSEESKSTLEERAYRPNGAAGDLPASSL